GRSGQDRTHQYQRDGCPPVADRKAQVSFWRKDVIDFALDQETQKHIDEQRAWIAQEPANPQPYCNLASLYRMCGRQDEALGLLLESVRLAPAFAEAHAALAEIYAIRSDYSAAWRHARAAQAAGESHGIELLKKYGIIDPDGQ